MVQRYVSRPWHLIFPLLLMLLATAVSIFDGWIWFSIGVFLMGIGSSVWIILAGVWEAQSHYWEKVTRFAEIMSKNRNPHLWSALGFRVPDEGFKVDLKTTNTDSSFGTVEYFDMPGSDMQFKLFSNGVLLGQPISEGHWAGTNKTYSVPVFRALKKELEKRELIRLKIAGKPTQGFVYTNKGKRLFLKYASIDTKEQLVNRVAPNDLSPLLPEAIPADY
jgi:hypothetical protein